MTKQAFMIDFHLSEAAWRFYSSDSFINWRVWSPFLFAFLGFLVALLGVLPPIPVFEHLPVWISVPLFVVFVRACVEVLPWTAARWRPAPVRKILNADGEILRLRLETELDIPLSELTSVTFQPPSFILVLSQLTIYFHRKDGSEYLVKTGVTDQGFFRALESLNQWLQGDQAPTDEIEVRR